MGGDEGQVCNRGLDVADGSGRNPDVAILCQGQILGRGFKHRQVVVGGNCHGQRARSGAVVPVAHGVVDHFHAVPVQRGCELEARADDFHGPVGIVRQRGGKDGKLASIVQNVLVQRRACVYVGIICQHVDGHGAFVLDDLLRVRACDRQVVDLIDGQRNRGFHARFPIAAIVFKRIVAVVVRIRRIGNLRAVGRDRSVRGQNQTAACENDAEVLRFRMRV